MVTSNMSLSHHAVLFYDILLWSVHLFCYPLVLLLSPPVPMPLLYEYNTPDCTHLCLIVFHFCHVPVSDLLCLTRSIVRSPNFPLPLLNELFLPH